MSKHSQNAPLKVAVIGLGYFSTFHMNAWAARTDAKLVGAADPHFERRVHAKATWDVDVFETAEQLLAEHDPDIVDLVVPPPAHAALIERATRPGRILICQKPFCQSLKEAQSVAELASAAGVTLIVHENFRFQPWYRMIKEIIESGRLGTIYQARFTLRPGDGRGADAYLSRQPAFRTMPRLLIHETGVHFVDLFRWLFGDITAVYADIRQRNNAIQGEDTGVFVLDHVGGTQSTFDGNRLLDHVTDNPRRTMGEMVIEGESGTVTLDGHGIVRYRPFGAGTFIEVPRTLRVDEVSFGGGCVAALIDHVVEAAAGLRPFENPAEDYLPVIRAVDAAYASAASGTKIRLD